MRRADRPDAQFVDEVRIRTVPRFKESELSGDEWRISAVIEFYRKGQLVMKRGWRNVDIALQFAWWSRVDGGESGKYIYPNIDSLCDQEGCVEPATRTFRLKKRYRRDGSEYEAQGEIRCFCDRHAHRGDCGLDDADANYEEIH